jgi:uncharacterized HhH-GPD family protein
MSRESTDRAIVEAMLQYSPAPPVGKPKRAQDLDDWRDWGIPREVCELLARDPNALLIGAIFDFGIPARKAWEATLELKKRLGHLNVRRIAEMRVGELAKQLRRGPKGPALHRFVAAIAPRVICACRKLVEDYGGCAGNIWLDGTRAGEVVRRLDGFDGIGQKISRMMGRLLVTYFGARLTNWGEIDVAVDRHVARVFLRSGLIRRPLGSYSVSEVKGDVIRTARQLHREFPAGLDDPAFSIGMGWCVAGKPYCDCEGEPCPLAHCCRRLTRMRIIEVGSGRSAVCTRRRKRT